MLSTILLSPILALLPVWSSKEIYLTWANLGEGYEYVLEIATDPEFNSIYLTSSPTIYNFAYVEITDTNKYYQRVKYHLLGSDIYDYLYLGQFYINLEHGIYSEDYVYIPPVEEIPQEKPVIPPIVVPPTIPPSVVTQVFILPEKIDYRENIATTTTSPTVLGASTQQSQTCNISLLRKDTASVKSWDCDLDIQISKVKYLDWEKYLSLDIEGTYSQFVYADIKVYECKRFSFFQPNTWFRCDEILVDQYKGDIKLIYFANTYVNGISQMSSNFAFMDSSFSIRNIFSEDISKKEIDILFKIYSQVKSKEWVDINYSIRKDIQIPTLEKPQVSRPFSFPLDRLIGVTQWHGCTQYQCPHKGIDFGARLNSVISIGDGKVVNVGYDRYGGECNQGGKFVIIKHTNGKYSAYIHLDSYRVKIGDSVKKGSLIGISGNTGMKNCQPLGYHLHFEIRGGLPSSTHVNPVPFVNVDWNSVPTIGYRQFPGRLGGENPHPNF